MQTIEDDLYRTNGFYRDLVDQMCAREEEKRILEQELKQLTRQREEERNTRRRSLLGYANQLPYQDMTPTGQLQWRVDASVVQNNYVRYWSAPVSMVPVAPQLAARQQEQLRRIFHACVSTAAQIRKADAPIAALLLDGLGFVTAENLLDAAKSAAAFMDTLGGILKSEF